MKNIISAMTTETQQPAIFELLGQWTEKFGISCMVNLLSDLTSLMSFDISSERPCLFIHCLKRIAKATWKTKHIFSVEEKCHKSLGRGRYTQSTATHAYNPW